MDTDGMVDPRRHDIDEKTQPVPAGDTDEMPERADINTGYPPVEEPGRRQAEEAREEGTDGA